MLMGSLNVVVPSSWKEFKPCDAIHHSRINRPVEMKFLTIFLLLMTVLALGCPSILGAAAPSVVQGAGLPGDGEKEIGRSGSDKISEYGLDGATLGLFWVLPFAGILLSIALLPLILPHFWHHHFGKVALFWALCFLIPHLIRDGLATTLYELSHVFLLEYLPFIILLFSLFTIAGGVRLVGRLAGSPAVNTVMLAIGTLAASFMGTTGAAMLLIRPFIRANEGRKHRVHSIVFFIFLVANVGGSLSPLGDPPLFLGFLKGVHFFWPTTHLLAPMLLVSVALLIIFFIWDSVLFRREGVGLSSAGEGERIRIEGKVNILLLGEVMAAVLMSGVWKSDFHLPTIFGVHVELQNATRDVLLLILAGLSWKLTPKPGRIANGFSWFPIVEVAKLFAGIFVTIIPAIAILKAGENGQLAGLIRLVTRDGQPFDAMYFWLTGLLSSFLDNAPTYLVFFNTAGGDATQLMKDVTTLLAISAGAVFFGASTYIGNAPNFMVRSIAQESGIKMPSFFGYMVYSFGILMPLFGIVTLIWFR